jgi:predicted transporter
VIFSCFFEKSRKNGMGEKMLLVGVKFVACGVKIVAYSQQKNPTLK